MNRPTSKMPLISIVICTGPNRLSALERCLHSIKQSKYKNVEVIVVDNSETLSVSKLIISKFPFTRYIQMPQNTGVFGFNVGYANARGKYILALDDDAAILPDTVGTIIHVLKTTPTDVGVIGCNSFNPQKKQYYHSHYAEQNVKTIYNQTIGGTVFKKEALQKAGYYDERFFAGCMKMIYFYVSEIAVIK